MSDRRNRATYQAVATTKVSAGSEPAGFLASLARVVASSGSVAGAARDLGVPRRTLRRWLTGEGKPNLTRQVQVETVARQLVRRVRIPAAREKRIRSASSVRIVAVFRYDGSTRDLTFHMTGATGPTDMASGTPGRVVDAFLAGAEGVDTHDPVDGGSGLFGPLARGMADDWYRERFLLGATEDQGFDVQSVRFQ